MRKDYGFFRFFKYFFLILLFFPILLRSQVIAIKAKKIYTVTHGVVENGVLLIEEGKIEDIGAESEVPWNAEIIDYSQKIIVPGLVEAHATRGYDRANETNPLTPFVTVLDSIDASHDAFKTALRDGVTTLNIMPGHNTILGGRGAILKSVGLVVEDMVLFPDSGMKISVVGTSAQTRMGVMAQLRRYFDETNEYIERKKREGTGRNEENMISTPLSFRSPEYVKYESVADLLQGRYQAFIYCQEPSDVIRAQKLSEKYGFQSVYILGPECYKAVDFIAEKKLKIILEPDLVYYDKDTLTDEFKKIDVVKEFSKKGLDFALQSDPEKVYARGLFYQAMKAMSSGMNSDQALKAITLLPAQILGADDLVGSIDKGKLANFVVLNDEPFNLSAKVEFVYIEGKKVYEGEKDEELKRLKSEEVIH